MATKKEEKAKMSKKKMAVISGAAVVGLGVGWKVITGILKARVGDV